jgi:lycopene cyclase domain-containing protein
VIQHYLYLLLNIGSILIPFLFSFYPKTPFYKKWKYLWISTLIPAILFLVWDAYFTNIGVWGFNKHYLIGVYLASLPLEEILFFFCIPYACIFTYEALNYLIKRDYLKDSSHTITWVLILSLGTLGIMNYTKWYTAVTFISLSLFLLFLQVKVKPAYLGRFYFAFLVILIPFFIVNGILTGSLIEQQVVWYNDSENVSIRIGTIPVEDIFYGMLLILSNVFIFEWLQLKKHRFHKVKSAHM